ncbi:prepilin-type N-terminal cleavage/methylation domain-containing protein [Candidatus Parcubacteria bacterium]|nr:prepilin-type N-terminal cleavage/methylation domain-containing protein [Candidatus Parcubacteria bacterium]
MSRCAPYRRGVSAIELLIAVLLLGVLLAIAVGPFAAFRESQAVSGGAAQLVSFLDRARSAALSGKDASAHGVHFEASRAVLFKGTSYSEGASGNEELLFDTSSIITTIAGGGNDIVFNALSGETQNYGTVTVRSKGDPAKEKIITISQSGVISRN